MADAMEAAEQLTPLRDGVFGGGPHACPGLHLARLEQRAVMEEWHRRIPYYRLGPGGSDRVEWPAGLIGIDSLPRACPPGGGLP